MPRSKRGANRVSALLNWFGRTRCKAEESWQSFSQCVAVFLVFPVKPTPPVLLHIVICDKQSRQSITLVTLCLTTSLIFPRLRAKGLDWREDHHASFRDLQHVFQVYRAQRRFSSYEYQLSTLLQQNTCCAYYHIRIVANPTAGQCLHGTRNHDHAMRQERPRRQRCRNVERRIKEVCQ
jgi:hypothetical protein